MKSISPIVGTILIIVMTVAISGIFYAFTSGTFNSIISSSNNLVNQQSKIISFTINSVYCSNNILYFNIYNNGNIPININNSQIIFTDNNGNTISINGSNIICNNGNIINIGSNSLCYVLNYSCYYNYTDYIKSTNFVYNGISYNYEILDNNKFIIYYSSSNSTSNTSACQPAYLPLILYNTQSISTPSPFQQDIAICNGSINMGTDFAYINNATLFNEIDSNGQNIYFTTTCNSTPNIYSWYEGQLINGSTYCDVWWINLPNGIPANSNIIIYMYIGNSSSNYYQQYYPNVGEAPYLSSTYGQYDNGNYVFNYYWNFNGTTLPNNLVCTVLSNPSGASGSCSVNNSITISNTNGTDFWNNYYMITYLYYNQSISIPAIVEAKVLSLTGNSGDSGWTKAGILYQNQVNDSSDSNGEVDMEVTDGNGYAIQWQSGTSYIAPSGNYNGGSITYPTILALVFPNTSYACGFYGSSLGVLSQEGRCVTPTSMASQGYIGLLVTAHSSSGTSSAVFQYLLVRAYPPNGVMPSIILSLAVNWYAINISNIQSISTPSPFQQDIAICNGNPNLSSSFAYINNVTLFNEINPNGQNVYFTTTYNSTPNIYSWYEGQLNYNGVTCDVWWINLPNGIPANSNITIYMAIGNYNTNYYPLYYPYVGTNEQVIGTMQYDNGQDVFIAYGYFDNTFDGWSRYIYAGSFSPTATPYGIEMINDQYGEGTYILPPNNWKIPLIPLIVEEAWYFDYNGGQANAVSLFGNTSQQFNASSIEINYGGWTPAPNLSTFVESQYGVYKAYLKSAVTFQGLGSITFSPPGTIYTYLIVNSTYAQTGYYYYNSNQVWVPLTLLDTYNINYNNYTYANLNYNPFQYGTLEVSAGTGGDISDQYIEWVVARAYPPNGVMPSIYIG